VIRYSNIWYLVFTSSIVQELIYTVTITNSNYYLLVHSYLSSLQKILTSHSFIQSIFIHSYELRQINHTIFIAKIINLLSIDNTLINNGAEQLNITIHIYSIQF